MSTSPSMLLTVLATKLPPILPPTQSSHYHEVTASADSTRYQDAIQTVAPINLPRLPMVFTSEYSQSPVDPLINLLGEADVVRSSVAHLLGPVDIALHSVLPSELARWLWSNSEYVVGRSRLEEYDRPREKLPCWRYIEDANSVAVKVIRCKAVP